MYDYWRATSVVNLGRTLVPNDGELIVLNGELIRQRARVPEVVGCPARYDGTLRGSCSHQAEVIFRQRFEMDDRTGKKRSA